MPPSNPTGTRPAPVIHKGHTGWVWSVAFAPDSNSLTSGSGDSTVRIWNPYSPSPKGDPLTEHTSSVRSVSYSPGGDIIASGSVDKTIRLWDASTRRQLGQPLIGHTSDVFSVVFSPDGRLIASGSGDKIVRVWDVKGGKPVSSPFEGHTSLVRSVAFTPDSTCIVSGSYDKTICIWDVERQKTVVGPLRGHTSSVLSVAVSPDGSQIISGSRDKTLRLWDARSGQMIGSPYKGHTGGVRSVSFPLTGIYFASGSGDKTVRVWDVRAGCQVDEPYEQHTGEVLSVACSPNGKYVASGSEDRTVMVWDISGSGIGQPEDTQAVFDDDNHEHIDRQVSIQDMFSLLADHGCPNLAAKMDPTKYSAMPLSRGGFGDIWRGELFNGIKVAIKVCTAFIIEQSDYKTLKRVTREIYHWSKMKHDNVHELMGVVLFMGRSLGMVSEWMDNGNLHEYLRKNPNANRYELCVQVASGVAYIHSCHMVHGDIKALNVLISSNGVAKLTDFGLSSMSESSLEFSATTSQAGSIRWASPEQLLEASARSVPSDIYALGMTLLETFTGSVPYYPQCLRDFQVLLAVQQGILPTRPANHIKDDERGDRTWRLLVSCWDRRPDERPSAKEVAGSLTEISSLGN